MKIFLERTIAQEALDEIRCNHCGRQLKRNHFGYFEDYLSVSKTWGYGPPVDGETHAFDLCYDCYTHIIASFQIPPRVDVGIHELAQ